MRIYRHTQVGTYMLWSAAAVTALVFWIVPEGPDRWAPLGLVLAIELAVLLLIGTLTVEVSGRELSLSFGAGLIRKRFPLDEITDLRPVRNRWYYGWGIRLTPHGWLYNVAGLDAVEIEMEGGRRVRVGTDEPRRLLEALRTAAGTASRQP